jgi:hypothetical protein
MRYIIRQLITRLKRPNDLMVGQRVRLADMNGCMAHRRENVRDGEIISLTRKKVSGDFQERWYADIKLTSGEIVSRCADRYLWTMHDGILEYQD